MYKVRVLDRDVVCEGTGDVFSLIEAMRVREGASRPAAAEKEGVAVRPAVNLIKEVVKRAARKDADSKTRAIAAMAHILDEGEIPVSKLAKRIGVTHKGRGTVPVINEITAFSRQAGVRVNSVLTFRKVKPEGTLYIAGKNMEAVLKTALAIAAHSKT
jgi:hypothetical protein